MKSVMTIERRVRFARAAIQVNLIAGRKPYQKIVAKRSR